jgi:hypothetical protein
VFLSGLLLAGKKVLLLRRVFFFRLYSGSIQCTHASTRFTREREREKRERKRERNETDRKRERERAERAREREESHFLKKKEINSKKKNTFKKKQYY